MSLAIFASSCVTGALYALTALAIVIIYKSSRIANFALGGTASLAVYAAYEASGHHLPYPVLVLIAVAVGVVTGVFTELVLRLLGDIDHITAAVATFAIALAAQGIIIWRYGADEKNLNPAWPITDGWRVGGALISYNDVLIVAIALAVTIGLQLVVQRTRFGLAVRMASSGPLTARLMGVHVTRVRGWTWAVGGGLGGLAALLTSARGSLSPSGFLSFMMIALVALVLGGFTNIWGAAIGSLVLGIVLNTLSANLVTTLTEGYLLVIVALLLFIRPNGLFGVRDGLVPEPVLTAPRFRRAAASVHSAAAAEGAGPGDERLGRRRRWGRPASVAAIGVVIFALLPYYAPAGVYTFLPQLSAIYLAVLGLNVLVGYSGQLSVGQSGFVAVGAYAGAIFANHLQVAPLLTIPIAAVCGLVVGLIIGLPAVRLGPFFLVLFTLVLSFAVPEVTIYFDGLTGGTSGLPFAFPAVFFEPRNQYWLGLAIAAVCTVLVFVLRQVSLGRRWVAVRDTPAGAQSVGLSPAAVKLTAFVVASGLAALSGVLMAGFTGFVAPTDYSPYLSITLLVAIVVGGIGLISGSVVGAVILTLVSAYGSSLGGIPPDLLLGIVLLVVLIVSPGGAAHVGLRAARGLGALSGRFRARPAKQAQAALAVEDRREPEVAVGTTSAAGEGLLEVRGISADYSGAKALVDVSMVLPEGSVTALVGSNGAGKTTLLRVISGLLPPSSGTVWYAGEKTLGVAPHRLARKGIAHVPEGRGIFPDLTVRENLASAVFTQRGRKSVDIAYAFEVFPALKNLELRRAGLLSGGEQQMLAVGRALLTRPRLLLLDEPTLGLSPVMAKGLIRSLEEVRKLGLTVLIVEQNARAALEFADSAYVMSGGRVVQHGVGDELLAGDVLSNYLGVKA